MSFIFLLFLIFIGYFFIWPLLRIILRINSARRSYADMMNRASSRTDENRKGGWGKSSRRRKKIDRETGEYVAFEEISCNVENSEKKNDTTFTVEQQVVDAEWEDVK